MTKIANPRYVALEPLRVGDSDGVRMLEPFEEIPDAESWGDALRREIRAGRVGVMLVPTDDVLREMLLRAAPRTAARKAV